MADDQLMFAVMYGIMNFGLPVLFLCGLGIYHCCQRRHETGGAPPPPVVEVAAASGSAAAVERLDGVTYVRPQQQSADEAASEKDGGGGDDDYDCAICLGPFEAGDLCSVMPGCRHEFHRACIAGWFKARNSTCPLCRAQLQWPPVGAQDMV
ncbi:hypothetical protein BS78_05G012600 [Paspalum vaginatum]|nr:hypothetical protein BS78_05G012600 [Paspalum vaginatum]